MYIAEVMCSVGDTVSMDHVQLPQTHLDLKPLCSLHDGLSSGTSPASLPPLPYSMILYRFLIAVMKFLMRYLQEGGIYFRPQFEGEEV